LQRNFTPEPADGVNFKPVLDSPEHRKQFQDHVSHLQEQEDDPWPVQKVEAPKIEVRSQAPILQVHHAAPVVSNPEVKAFNSTPKVRKSRSDRKSRTSVAPSGSIPETVVNPFKELIPEIVDTPQEDPLVIQKEVVESPKPNGRKKRSERHSRTSETPIEEP